MPSSTPFGEQKYTDPQSVRVYVRGVRRAASHRPTAPSQRRDLPHPSRPVFPKPFAGSDLTFLTGFRHVRLQEKFLGRLGTRAGRLTLGRCCRRRRWGKGAVVGGPLSVGGATVPLVPRRGPKGTTSPPSASRRAVTPGGHDGISRRSQLAATARRTATRLLATSAIRQAERLAQQPGRLGGR